MKAIGYTHPGAITNQDALINIDMPIAELGSRDLLVEVLGVSVNPVDVKLRQSATPINETRILGFDAAGIVSKIGTDVKDYKIGDEVFYAGDITRPGTNAQYHAVDERIVGRKPKNLDFSEAAGLPLTSITAWELLFDSLNVTEGSGQGRHLLVIGGAGGVGSILIQLAKQLTNLTIIATASRPETIAWVQKMGADHVLNHRDSLVDQLKALNLQPQYVAALTGTDQHFPTILESMKPRGHIAFIDDPDTLDIKGGKSKALSFSWEFMFTHSMYQTEDMQSQQKLLNRVSKLIEEGTLISTVTQNLGPLTPTSLKAAHAQQETGRAIGKIVLGTMT